MYNFQCPAIESSYSMLEDFIKDYPTNIKEHCFHYWAQGYTTLMLDDVDFEGIKQQINDHLLPASAVPLLAQSSVYQYNDSPRVFEAWKWCKPVLDLARHPKILELLKYLYGKDAIPFQTINFKKGSDQPLHSDVIHFHTVPERWVAGVWVALEDMDEENGTLQYVPGSHKLPTYDFQDLGLEKSIFLDPNDPQFTFYPPREVFEKAKLEEEKKHEESYRAYEQFIRDLTKHAYKKKLVCKKGTAFVWAANLIHAGYPIKDQSRTRWSQAIHYYFKNCRFYHSTMYGDPSAGDYAEKDLTKKDILNHVI